MTVPLVVMMGMIVEVLSRSRVMLLIVFVELEIV
jgi:hypothetical protein